jgi:amino acid transporter
MGKLVCLLPIVPLVYSLLVPWMVFNPTETKDIKRAVLIAVFFCISQPMMSGATLLLLTPVIMLGVLSSHSIQGSSTALAPLFGVIVLVGALILAFVSATVLRYLENTYKLTFKAPWAPYAACALLLVVQAVTVLLAIPRPPVDAP